MFNHPSVRSATGVVDSSPQIPANQMLSQPNSSPNEVAIHSLIEELLLAVSEIKIGLQQLLMKVDSCGSVSAPNVALLLDSLSVTSGQMNMLCRKLSVTPLTLTPSSSVSGGVDSKYSLLSNIVFCPQNLSIEQDPHLARLTEDRARCFDHELVPLYLRTKLIPSLENKMQVLAEAAMEEVEREERGCGEGESGGSSSSISGSGSGNSSKETVKKIVEELEAVMQMVSSDLTKQDPVNTIHTCSSGETAYLLAALTEGKGIKLSAGMVATNTSVAADQRKMFTPGAGSVSQHPQMMSPNNNPSAGNANQRGGQMGMQGVVMTAGSQSQQAAPPTIVKPIIRS